VASEAAPTEAQLFLVSTPIGNLRDITHRALETLGAVGDVFAEDTRRTRVLLDHYGIRQPLHSLHQHNEVERAARVLDCLRQGRSVALVTDAGTPLVSDPGARLVEIVVEAGYRVVPIPGASAPLAALAVSGLPAERFTFLGFPPRKGGGRTQLLERVAASEETCILFEAPGRVGRLVEELAAVCGPERPAALARELTKLHEEVLRDTLGSLAQALESRALKGEITLVVAPAAKAGVDEETVRREALELLEEGLSPSRAAQVLSQRLGIPRNRSYRVVQSVTPS